MYIRSNELTTFANSNNRNVSSELISRSVLDSIQNQTHTETVSDVRAVCASSIELGVESHIDELCKPTYSNIIKITLIIDYYFLYQINFVMSNFKFQRTHRNRTK